MVMKLIYIEWHDAFSHTGWMDKNNVEKIADHEEYIVKQVGWLFKETKREIVLVSQYKPEDVRDDELFGSIQKIPKTWIRKRVNLTKYIK